MQYNTQQKRLPLPEYGRGIQHMVDYALTLTDRAERQRCAQSIIRMMGTLFPQLRDVPDFTHKLWDHLAIMADFKLDIDYPYTVVSKEEFAAKPAPIPYPKDHIRYRHYGRYVSEILDRAVALAPGKEKDMLIYLAACNMKKKYITWNKDGVEDRKIFIDIFDYTQGAIEILPEDMELPSLKDLPSQQQSQSYQPRKKMKFVRRNNNSKSN